MVKISPQCFGTSGVEPIRRGAPMAEAVVPFAPKSNSKSEDGDQLDRAGQAILGLLHQAASTAEANNQKAIEMAHKLSAQLRAAEGRIRQLGHRSGITKIGQTELKSGCIKSRWRLSRSSLVATIIVLRKTNRDRTRLFSLSVVFKRFQGHDPKRVAAHSAPLVQ